MSIWVDFNRKSGKTYGLRTTVWTTEMAGQWMKEVRGVEKKLFRKIIEQIVKMITTP